MARFTTSSLFGLLAAFSPVAAQDLVPIENALSQDAAYESRLRTLLFAAVPATAPAVMLRLPVSDRETLLAVHEHEHGHRATVVRPATQIRCTPEEVAVEVKHAEVTPEFAMRAAELWRAMLKDVRLHKGAPVVLDGESCLFSSWQSGSGVWAGSSSDPAAGSRAADLAAIGQMLVELAGAADDDRLAVMARLNVALAGLEQRLVTGDAPGLAHQVGERPDVDLRAQIDHYGVGPRPQGARPTCSIFTTVSAFEFALARATGRGQRLSVDYCNWAANAATGRRDDGDFFHCALAGWQKFGLCHDELWPYAAQFRGDEVPPAEALVDGGRVLEAAQRLRVRWIRPIGGGAGLDAAQMADLHATLAAGWPVAAGSAHSRLLVGYRSDPKADGGGVFLTMDSALNRFGEVPLAFVRDKVNDAFVIELRP